ncbi:MAG TPA: alpha/beta fold hydrolase [Acidimicrobiia bacterium]|nr:alpha/beta fold hydrolase [Acidimicrobiia bacterium]
MLGKIVWKLTKNLPRALMIGTGAGLAWSKLAVNHNMPLGPALPGSRLALDDGSGGHMTLYGDADGSGSPVLLVHSVNAAASAYEMRPVYSRLQDQRPVWALDLPGYGDSERGDRAYTPHMMAGAVTSALQHIGRPTHVVALSLGCEFAARSAGEHPELVQSLSLISPTGFGSPRGDDSPMAGFLEFPLWSQAIYDGIASRPSIRYFLGKSFAGPVDEMMVDYAYRTSHRSGARYAPIAFLTGRLFSPDAATELYPMVTSPTLVLYDRDPFTGFTRLPEFVAGADDWEAERIAGTNGLPHWDKPTETMNALLGFWERHEE